MNLLKALGLGIQVLDAIKRTNHKGQKDVDTVYIGLRTVLTELEDKEPEIATRTGYPFGLKHVEDALDVGHRWSDIPTLPAGLKDYSQ